MFVNMSQINTDLDYDVLYVNDEDNSVNVGFLYKHKGKLFCLVDVDTKTEGRVILLKPYTRNKLKLFLFNVFNVVV